MCRLERKKLTFIFRHIWVYVLKVNDFVQSVCTTFVQYDTMIRGIIYEISYRYVRKRDTVIFDYM